MQDEVLKSQFDVRKLEALSLPFVFEEPLKIEPGRRSIGFRFFKHVVEIRTKLRGSKIVVCGEADTAEIAEAKATSELIERAAFICSPHLAETSNGWAAHPHGEQARFSAILELVERDAVLAQWYSTTPFLVVDPRELPEMIRNWTQTELAESEFKNLRVLISTEGICPAVTCLFLNENGFGISGHSTKENLRESIESAIGETCRAAQAAIRRDYWSDTLKLKAAESGALSPGCHSVYYAYHEPFPDWMFGRLISWSEATALWQKSISRVLGDNKFTFQEILNLPIHVGFARHPEVFDLHWGTTDAKVVAESQAGKRLNLKAVNLKPHIVA